MPQSRQPVAVIDVGSNSVRLVVYSGKRRVPVPIFNEKVLAGLGKGLAETGAIDDAAGEQALAALRRFKLLIDHMGAGRTQLLATAAVRDASNGPAFARQIKALGLPCRIVQPDEEATLAGLGVISGIPAADGIVGDLGGGSLELVDVAAGQASRPISLPLGVFRAGANAKAVRDAIREGIDTAGLKGRGRDRTLYLVGGSWRSLARMDMIATGYPLPILHQYAMEPGRVAELKRLAASADPRFAKAIASGRLGSLPAAAMLLAVLVEELGPSKVMVSSFGIREGLLYSDLSAKERGQDPLLSAARELADAEGRLDAHGDALDRWLDGAFDDPPTLARLRLTACLLADAAWQANPQFRADRAVELALHGNWVGVGPAGRVLIAQALSSTFGRDKLPDPDLGGLCVPGDLKRARQWGLAMRAGQRLSGGVSSVLEGSALRANGSRLQLLVGREEGDLVSEAVLRRVTQLADAMQLKAEVAPA